jgi:hypothetical protein
MQILMLKLVLYQSFFLKYNSSLSFFGVETFMILIFPGCDGYLHIRIFLSPKKIQALPDILRETFSFDNFKSINAYFFMEF